MPLIDPSTGQPFTQGVSEQQPNINPVVEQSVSRLATASEKTLDTVKELHEVVKKMPSAVSEVSKKIENLGFELEDAVKFADDAADALKTVSKVAATLRRGIVNTKNLKDAVAAAQELADAQELIKKRTAAGTKEFNTALKAQKLLAEFAQKYKDFQGDATEAMKEFSAVMHNALPDAEKLAKQLKSMSVNHLNRQIHGVSKSLAQLGIGKGFAAKMDKYMAGAEAKEKIKEITAQRKAGNVAAAQARQAAAEKIVAAKRPDLAAGTPEYREAVGRRMGMRGSALKAYKEGDESGFEHGGGGFMRSAVSKAAGLMEGGLGEVGGMVAEAAPWLAIIEVIKELFDKFVKQNQDMEKYLGKAGLFSGEGAGFFQARGNLNPQNAFSQLGFSFDRNLKMAGAIAETGIAPEELVTGVGTRRAAERYGAGEGFGIGGFGQFQQIAMTSGRLAGLTDTESIQETVKLLQQYQESLDSSDDFFLKVKKSSEAAGLTTTKFIGMIDDINSHFNRMNKNLDATLNILTELSKTGRVGSEDLKAYMDFLTAGGPPKAMADVSKNAFALMNMTRGQRQDRLDNAANALDVAIRQARGTAGINLSPEQEKQLRAGNFGKVIQELDLNLAGNKGLSPDQKQSATAALNLLSQTAGTASRMRVGGAINQAFGQLGAMSPMEVASQNLSKLDFAVRKSGGSMEEFMSDPQAFLAKHLTFAGLLETQGMDVETAMKGAVGQRQAATTMLNEFQNLTNKAVVRPENELMMRKNAIQFLKEFKRKYPNVPVKLPDKQIDEMSNEELQEAFNKNTKEFADVAAGFDETQHFVQQSFAMGRDVTDTMRQQALDQAKKVGRETQTSADIFANAFAKWFNDIISLLGKLYDIAAKLNPFAEARNALGTKAIYSNPLNMERKEQARMIIQERMYKAQNDLKDAQDKHDSKREQEALEQIDTDKKQLDQLEQQSEFMSDAKDWLAVIAQAVGPNLDDLTNEITGMTGQTLDKAALPDQTKSQIATDTYKALTAMGATVDANGVARLGPDFWRKAGASGAEQVNRLTSIGGLEYKGTQGDTSTYIITNHNYSADINHIAPAQQSVQGANPEEAPKTEVKPTKKKGK